MNSHKLYEFTLLVITSLHASSQHVNWALDAIFKNFLLAFLPSENNNHHDDWSLNALFWLVFSTVTTLKCSITAFLSESTASWVHLPHGRAGALVLLPHGRAGALVLLPRGCDGALVPWWLTATFPRLHSLECSVRGFTSCRS